MLPCITNNVTTISHFISSNLLQNGGIANNPAYFSTIQHSTKESTRVQLLKWQKNQIL